MVLADIGARWLTKQLPGHCLTVQSNAEFTSKYRFRAECLETGSATTKTIYLCLAYRISFAVGRVGGCHKWTTFAMKEHSSLEAYHEIVS